MKIEERLEKLERDLKSAKNHNRLLLSVMILAVVGLLMVWIIMMSAPIAQAQRTGRLSKESIIKAHRIDLYDRQGKIRAQLGIIEGMPPLGIGVQLGIIEGVPSLGLYDEHGKPRIVLGIKDSIPSLGLIDNHDKNRIVLGITEDVPSLGLIDKYGKSRVMLGITEDAPSLGLIDKYGILRVMLRITKNGPDFQMLNEYEKPFWGRSAVGAIGE